MIEIWALLRPFLPYLIAAGAVFGLIGYHKAAVWNAHRVGVNEGSAKIMAEWKADADRRDVAALQVAQAYQVSLAETNTLQKRLEDERAKAFAPIYVRIRDLPSADAHIRIPASAVGVLDDAIRAANSGIAGSAGKVEGGSSAAAADSTVGAFTQWSVTCADLYERAVQRVRGWESFYSGLRAAQPKEQTP